MPVGDTRKRSEKLCGSQSLLKVKSKIESPDYECRGTMVLTRTSILAAARSFGWISINIEDYFDWFISHRMKRHLVTPAQSPTISVLTASTGAQLGPDDKATAFGTLNRPAATYFKDHPDWYRSSTASANRCAKLPILLPEPVCVSNRACATTL